MYICGIDGGGTKTRIVLADLDGKAIDSIIVGPSSIDTATFYESTQTISLGIETIMLKNKLDGKITSVFAGLGGISSSCDIKKINSLLLETKHIANNAVVSSANDVKNAWYAGCSGRPSIVLIVGTGSAAYGVDESGATWRAGGISYLEGDYGSSYDLGLRALKYLARAFDRRIEATPFTQYLQKKFEIKSFKDLTSVFITYVPKRTQLANYAKSVTKWAGKGDLIALKIVDEGTTELLNMIKAVDNNISLSNKEVSIIGSLGNFDSPYKTELIKKVNRYFNKEITHSNEIDPADAALKMALFQLANRN
jgi:N-acetylglucosamine kinase-like BadF-type ATPase